MGRLTRAISFVAMLVLLCSGKISHASGNTQTTYYQFNNTASTGYTTYRAKNDNSKVYVHPTSGMTLYYSVYGAYNTSGSGEALCSSKVFVPVGTTAKITNSVYENGYSFAKLKFERISGSPVNINTTGIWSPDSN